MMRLNFSHSLSFGFCFLLAESEFLCLREDGKHSNQMSSNPWSKTVKGANLDLKAIYLLLLINNCSKKHLIFTILTTLSIQSCHVYVHRRATDL